MNRCTDTGERSDLWPEPRQDLTDLQNGGLFLFGLFKGLGRAMRREPMSGSSCDVHENSILAIAARQRGIALGPVLYAANSCRAPLPSCAVTRPL